MPKPDYVSKEERPDVSLGASQETVAPGQRRKFSASEKLRLLKAADEAIASGVRGAVQELLRRERIYGAQLATWRRQFGLYGEAGLARQKPGRIPMLDSKDRELLATKKEVAVLEKKLRVANALLALQKKVQEILGLVGELP